MEPWNDGSALPPKETDLSKLTAKMILDKLQAIKERIEKNTCESAEFIPGYFMALLERYPVSLCSRDMTDTLKTLIAYLYVQTHENAKAEAKKRLEEHRKPQTSRFGAVETVEDALERWENNKDRYEKEARDVWEGYSYEDLAVMFDRSKASIHDAIREKHDSAMDLYLHHEERAKAREIAMRELIEEEKQKLRASNEKTTEETSKQTNEGS